MAAALCCHIGRSASAYSQAIEKIREELRKKRHVREERRRELEFLEKGGNPLDFQFAHVETGSVPSTSLTNQIAGQNVTSEAKSRFAASPHGDSLESNDRPGSSLCQETSTADGGDRTDIVEDKFVKRGTKRSNAAQPKQSLSAHSNKSSRRPKESSLSRLVKSQSYVRRNRSKPSRDSAIASKLRSSGTPAKGSEAEPRDENDVAQRNIADDSVSVVKPSGSYSYSAPKNTTSDDQVTIGRDGFQDINTTDCVAKNESKAEEVASVEIPGASPNVFMRQCDSGASTHDERESCAGDENADDSNLDKCVGHVHVGELDKNRVDPAYVIEDPGIHKNAVYQLYKGTKIIVDDSFAVDSNLVAMAVDGKSHDDLNNSRYCIKTLKESVRTMDFIEPTSVEVNMDHVIPESSNTCLVKDAMEVSDSAIIAQKDTGCPSSGCIINIEGSPPSDKMNENCLGAPISSHHTTVGTDLPKNYMPDAIPSLKSDESNMESEIKKSENLDKMATKVYEDSILRNARTIEASIRRAGERLPCNCSLEKRRKGHWDFVLVEMAWMANDFMQERLWKSVAAAQMCRWIASDGRAKFEEANILRTRKTIMKNLTKRVMSFWCSAEASQTAHRTAIMQEHNSTILEETNDSIIKTGKEQGNKSLGAGESPKPRQSQIQDYAVRFLEYNCRTTNSLLLPEAPPTPERLNDFCILKVSDQLSEESLYYTVATGAMMAYRESVESLFERHKRAGNTGLVDEYEASVCDYAADFPREDTYEDEGATEAYDGVIPKMCDKKKLQMHQRTIGARQYERGTYVPYESCLESKSGNRSQLSNVKKSFPVVPAKRILTVARQRLVSPFHASANGAPHATNKADASSGDTDSIQDDESSLHGESLKWRNMDYESTADFDRQLHYDAGEVSTKANKKKKLNNSGCMTAKNTANSFAPALFQNHTYERRPQLVHHLKKRPDSPQCNSNGIYGSNDVQHASKKLKMMRQGIYNSPEASRVASQISNIANHARFIKIIANREHGRKCKALKMTSSDGWSNFEDQALVVLVHDMGQNWELVCDAINSMVRFKSVYRQPNECKERHKVLVDRSSSDVADSAEDSGSSQRYHNSLPGIPKGSARQLFERLQGPFQEENLKEHFEKIILLMQQVHSGRRQVNSRELKSIMQPHSSHVITLSQICVNKLPGGCLTPLDLCDSTSPNLDSVTPGSLSLGLHSNGLTLRNHQSSAGPATPTSSLTSRVQRSPGMIVSSNLLSSSRCHRGAQKHGVPRHGDEQPKTQYNPVVGSRNFQQPGGSVPGVFPTGIDHSGCTMPGNLVPNSGQGTRGPVNFHPGGISCSGISILRAHDPVQPGYRAEEHKHVPDMHVQILQESCHTANVNGINLSFSNVVASPPIQQPQRSQKKSLSSHMFGNQDHSQIQEASASPQRPEYPFALA